MCGTQDQQVVNRRGGQEQERGMVQPNSTEGSGEQNWKSAEELGKNRKTDKHKIQRN